MYLSWVQVPIFSFSAALLIVICYWMAGKPLQHFAAVYMFCSLSKVGFWLACSGQPPDHVNEVYVVWGCPQARFWWAKPRLQWNVRATVRLC
jgi:hypothetical protein